MASISAVWSRKFDNFGLLNSVFITLLPKKDAALHIKDFCPLNLVYCFAKLVTKILANRLAIHLDQMMSPNQSAFIKGRFIQDNFMLVHQTTKFLHQQRQLASSLSLTSQKLSTQFHGLSSLRSLESWGLVLFCVTSLVGFLHHPLRKF